MKSFHVLHHWKTHNIRLILHWISISNAVVNHTDPRLGAFYGFLRILWQLIDLQTVATSWVLEGNTKSMLCISGSAILTQRFSASRGQPWPARPHSLPTTASPKRNSHRWVILQERSSITNLLDNVYKPITSFYTIKTHHSDNRFIAINHQFNSG